MIWRPIEQLKGLTRLRGACLLFRAENPGCDRATLAVVDALESRCPDGPDGLDAVDAFTMQVAQNIEAHQLLSVSMNPSSPGDVLTCFAFNTKFHKPSGMFVQLKGTRKGAPLLPYLFLKWGAWHSGRSGGSLYGPMSWGLESRSVSDQAETAATVLRQLQGAGSRALDSWRATGLI